MITSEQLRAARAALDLSIEDVAARCGLSQDIIHSAERGPASAGEDAPTRLQTFYESLGITFIGAGQDGAGFGAGLRMGHQRHDEGLRPQDLNAQNDD